MLDLERDLPREQIAELCRRYHVRELSIFGSAVREDFRDDSDFDFLVEFDPNVSIGIEFIRLGHELEDLLGRKVDLVSKRALRPRWRENVLASARLLYAA